MSDTPSSPVEASPVSPSPLPGVEGPQLSDKEIADGKLFAILSYAINFVGFPFWIIPLVQRNNDFAIYHAKQCLVAWIVVAIGWIVAVVLSFFCIGFLIIPIVAVAALVLNIMGILAAVDGKCKPLPVIGGLAEKWFAGIKKVPGAT